MHMLRKENGGAREEGLPRRLCSVNRTNAISTCPQTSSLRPHDTGRISAGNPPALLNRTSDLSLTVCLTTRFDGPDSSISCRIACRSSVAEITGNSSIRTQPKSTKERIPPKHRQSLVQTDSCRHIQMAGNANISHRRLSANSIRSGTRATTICDGNSLAKYRIQVNVTARACTPVRID